MESIDKQKAKLAWIANNKKALDDIERKRLVRVRLLLYLSLLNIVLNLLNLFYA